MNPRQQISSPRVIDLGNSETEPVLTREIIEEALLKVGKDTAFRKVWENVVLEGTTFEQMFTGKEVFENVKVYTDWRPKS